jgi:hypothetical protein
LAKTNREQSLIVHALFGKWILRNLEHPTGNRGPEPWVFGEGFRCGQSPERSRISFDGLRRPRVRGELERCDRSHSQIEHFRILVFMGCVAAFAWGQPLGGPEL